MCKTAAVYSDPPLPDSSILRALDDNWGVTGDTITYKRIGYGSFHWAVTETGGARWFVTADRYDSPFPVVAAYALSRRLADSGLEFVRAPVRNSDGKTTLSIDGLWLSLWPWVAGRTSDGHNHRDAEDLVATLTMVRRLHDHRDIEVDPSLIEDWRLGGRDGFWASVDAGGAGPYAAEVCRRVHINRQRITEMLARYDELVAVITGSGTEFVITHGEPHAGNVIHTDIGPKLIDWDTVRWAPKERDLWSLAHHDGWRTAYGRDDISTDALQVYRLQWDLSEIIDFVGTLLAAPTVDPDTEVAAKAVRELLPA